MEEGNVEQKVITAEKAKELVQQERQQRGEACGNEINKLLAKYRCRMEWVEVHVNGRLTEAKWRIVPLE